MPRVTDTRERILDEALRRFAHDGYGRTSLDDVAEAVGIRKQSLLYHFGSKEDLFAAAATQAARAVAAAMEDAVQGPDPGELGRLEALVAAVHRLADEHPALFGMIREVARVGPPLSDRVAEALRPLAHSAVAWMERAMDAGRVRRQNPRVAILTIYSAIVGHLTESSVRAALLDGADRGDAERELVAFLRAALAP